MSLFPDGASKFMFPESTIAKKGKSTRLAKSQQKPRPHNPDNLTKKQVGRAPWRLLDEDEIKERDFFHKTISLWSPSDKTWSNSGWQGTCPYWTFRTRLTRAQLRSLK